MKIDTSNADVMEFAQELQAEVKAFEEAREKEPAQPVDTELEKCRAGIDAIMRMPEKPFKDCGPEDWMLRREKYRLICEMVRKHMETRGTFWSCANNVVYVPNATRRNISVIGDGREFLTLMAAYGLYAADPATTAVSKQLNSEYAFPHNTVRLLSYYHRERETLYVNEYAGRMLKITVAGVDSVPNGMDGILMDWGEGKCDPLDCRAGIDSHKALDPAEGGLIQKHILDIVKYPEDGIGRESAHLLLMSSLLSLYFQERLSRATPLVTFTGPGGSMKSACASAVGKLIQGREFQVTHSPEGKDAIMEIKNLAIGYPFLVLDEANWLKGLSNILKVIGTGGSDKRRILYTTSTMQESPYQSRLWLTMNTGDPHEETVASRMLIIDVAAPLDVEPYRATYYLQWSNELRNAIWTELVGRLWNAMRSLAQADFQGTGDLGVAHRMSDFFVFGLTLAKGDGLEQEFRKAMDSIGDRQETAVSDSVEVIDLVAKIPKVLYHEKELKAQDWGKVFLRLVGWHDYEMRKKVIKKNVVAWWFKSNENLLTKRFGMKKRVDAHSHTTFYSFSNLNEAPTTCFTGFEGE